MKKLICYIFILYRETLNGDNIITSSFIIGWRWNLIKNLSEIRVKNYDSTISRMERVLYCQINNNIEKIIDDFCCLSQHQLIRIIIN